MKGGGAALGRRFSGSLVIYAMLIFLLWMGYHNITYEAVRSSAGDNAEIAAENLLIRVSSEFEQMKTAASVIAGSIYVQDFLSAADVASFYEKAGTVSEIIQKIAYPISTADSVLTINSRGDFYRFTGGISNEACKNLYEAFHGSGTVYTILELDGILFFCHSAPVFSAAGRTPERVGTVFILTGLNRTRKALREHMTTAGVDTALISEDAILLASEPSLENKDAGDIETLYGLIVYKDIEGTNLSVAATVSEKAMFPGSSLFMLVAVCLLALLLAMITVLYRYLSKYFIKPMTSIIQSVREIGGNTGHGRVSLTNRDDFDTLVTDINNMLDRTEEYNTVLLSERQKLFDAKLTKQKMQIWMLSSQIDAHFLVNTIESIHTLSSRGDNANAELMAEGLAQLLKHRNAGDSLVNIFVEFEMVEKYISIMNIRHEGKFNVDYNVDDCLSAYKMPGYILQPIVENALTHGLQNKIGDARLSISGKLQSDTIVFEISDNGAGIPPARLRETQDELSKAEIEDFPEPGLHGVALINIQRRIRLRFGNQYGLTVTSVMGEGATVTVRLPTISDE